MHRSPIGRRTVRVLTAVSCAAVLASCGGDDGGGRGSPADRGAVPSGSGPGAAASGDRAPDDAGRGESARVDAGGGGADAAGGWPGATDDTAVLARRRVSAPRPEGAPASVRPTTELLIRGLTVRGRIATLRFTAIVRGWRGGTSATGGAPALYDVNPGPRSESVSAQLIDPVNLRRHEPLEDSAGEILATMNYAGQTGDGQPIDASWMFAAPPEGVDAMDVQVGSWPVFREIPVTRR